MLPNVSVLMRSFSQHLSHPQAGVLVHGRHGSEASLMLQLRQSRAGQRSCNASAPNASQPAIKCDAPTLFWPSARGYVTKAADSEGVALGGLALPWLFAGMMLHGDGHSGEPAAAVC